MKNKNILIWTIIVALVTAGGVYWYNKDQDISTSGEGEVMENETEFTNTSGQPEVSKATMEIGEYEVDEDNSSIVWQAGKPALADYVHTGKFNISEGSVTLTEAELTGQVEIDVSSMEVLSLGGGKEGKESLLEKHLKGEGFFNTAEYPAAAFTITSVSPEILPSPDSREYTATGELTMKGVTNEVTFPMEVVVASGAEVWMNASFTIDRTRWGIDAGSASVVEKITDQVIGDDVELELTLRLTK